MRTARLGNGFAVAALLVGVMVSLYAPGPVLGAEADPPVGNLDDDAREEKIRELIGKLGDDSPEIRKSATEELARIGSPAVAALEAATRSSDPEVRWRAKEALANIRSRQGGVPKRSGGSRTRAIAVNRSHAKRVCRAVGQGGHRN